MYTVNILPKTKKKKGKWKHYFLNAFITDGIVFKAQHLFHATQKLYAFSRIYIFYICEIYYLTLVRLVVYNRLYTYLVLVITF